MDEGGMKGTGKPIHEMFDIIFGTSTGGMLVVALGVKQMSLEKCEEIYKELGKLVFAELVPKDNEAVTWREKLALAVIFVVVPSIVSVIKLVEGTVQIPTMGLGLG